MGRAKGPPRGRYHPARAPGRREPRGAIVDEAEGRPGPAPLPGAEEAEGVDRRRFLAGAASTATIAWFWFEGFGEPLRRRRIEPTAPGAPRVTLTAAEWDTLGAAQDRILPSSP